MEKGEVIYERRITIRCWKCLPKEAREEIKKDFKSHPSAYHPYFNEGYEEALKIYFGHHNLTSDTEPEEMLMILRKEVQKLYRTLELERRNVDFGLQDKILYDGKLDMLDELFGDKCLPDKEPSVQVEPKKFFESDYGIGNKVVVCISSIGEPRKEVVTLIRQYQPQCENNDYAKTWVIQTQDGQTFQSNEEHFEPYAEPEYRNLSQEIANCDKSEDNQLNDNMEEEKKLKELFSKENLDEIVSSMLEYTAVITQDVINEASKYKPEEERIFIKGAAWMLYHLVKNRGQRHIYIDSDMSLDEAIQHCEEVLPLAETAQCAREHVQLRDWLTELKQRRENKQ